MRSKTYASAAALFMQVIDGDLVTGLQMHQRISAAVYLLRARGVVPGDRVLITMVPSVDFFALTVATLSVGEQKIHSLRAMKTPLY